MGSSGGRTLMRRKSRPRPRQQSQRAQQTPERPFVARKVELPAGVESLLEPTAGRVRNVRRGPVVVNRDVAETAEQMLVARGVGLMVEHDEGLQLPGVDHVEKSRTTESSDHGGVGE